MATTVTNISITTTQSFGTPVSDFNKRPFPCAQALANYIQGWAGGSQLGTIDVQTANQATGTITFASSSGTVGAIINGVTVTVTWATSDTASAAALVTAINTSANALVNLAVSATSAAGVITLTSKLSGPAGNWVSLAASGTNVTASGARLTGGAATSNSVTF